MNKSKSSNNVVSNTIFDGKTNVELSVLKVKYSLLKERYRSLESKYKQILRMENFEVDVNVCRVSSVDVYVDLPCLESFCVKFGLDLDLLVSQFLWFLFRQFLNPNFFVCYEDADFELFPVVKANKVRLENGDENFVFRKYKHSIRIYGFSNEKWNHFKNMLRVRELSLCQIVNAYWLMLIRHFKNPIQSSLERQPLIYWIGKPKDKHSRLIGCWNLFELKKTISALSEKNPLNESAT